MTDPRSTPTAETGDAEGPEGDDERLYDAYLDAALGGRVETPAAFLARHPRAGALLRARLEALHGMLGDARATPAGDAEGADATGTRDTDEDLPYERLGEFRLIRRLDEGGMGTVYLAEQESLGRIVALKVIRPELHGSPTAAARFEREAQVIARLRHANIVTAFAVGVDRGVHYLALEFVPGRGLDEILSEAAAAGRRIPPPQAVTWAAQIARALECAHAAGIVHRDVKPGNIRITPDGRALLLDFGIAHDAEALGLTRTGPLLGSPAYAAPEQVGATGRIGPHTDVHGLGATLYECLSGRAPYLGKTIEETLHHVLETQATPVRRLNAAVSRDLETVLAHALEKDPARRYPTAAALADDLEALLAFRPIAARRPGPLRRTVQWMRRHPAVAAGTLVAVLALAAAGAVSVARDRAESRQRQLDARAAVQQAGDAIERYRERRAETETLEKQVALLIEKQETKYLTDEQDRFLAREEDAAEVARREREQAFYDVLELLRQAERLDPAVPGVRRARAELYAEKWREMRAAGATGAARLYRDLVASDDPTGAVLATVEGEARVLLESDPAGAQVHLFRYRELSDVVPGGERRTVPCPAGDGDTAQKPLVRPGTWGFVVVEDAGALHAGDLIVELGGTRVEALRPADARAAVARGGEDASVLTGGALERLKLPVGLVARPTTQPLPLDASSRRGATPLDLVLPAGEYVAVLTAPGREPTRTWFNVKPGVDLTQREDLLPTGATPRGFVRVPRQADDVPYAFWIMEREVTAGEYLEYLNDPATRAAIDAGGQPPRLPRARAGEPLVERGADGLFALDAEWRPDWPVIAISQRDALAYAAYRNARRTDAHADHVLDLPSFDEWTVAAVAGEMRMYVFGRRFRPKWVSSCYSSPAPGPVPVLSFPRDESPTGALDMCGSAFEWSVDRYDSSRDLVRLLGGAWGRADPEMFKVQGGMGLHPDATSGETGMRLVLRPRDAR